MSYAISFSELAKQDLSALETWVATEAGDETATTYIERLERRCAALTEFPSRGAPRNELGPNVRSLVFDRQILILYRVDEAGVLILRVVHGARQISALRLE